MSLVVTVVFDTQRMSILIAEIPNIIKSIEEHYKKIKAKYVGIDAYVVFSDNSGQCSLKASAVDRLLYLPSMYLDSELKKSAAELLKYREGLNKQLQQANKEEASLIRNNLDGVNKELDEKVKALSVNPLIRVELRFNDLDHDMIKRLRQDELVDVGLTPQIAGIRIVLGTINDFLNG